MKTKKVIPFLLIVICVFAALIIFFVLENSNLNNGSIIYASSGEIQSYDVKSETKSEIQIDGFHDINTVGAYSGGDFCFIGTEEESDKPCAVFVQDGEDFKKVYLPCAASEVCADGDEAYILCGNAIYKSDLNSGEINIVVENAGTVNDYLLDGNTLFLSKSGVFAYVKRESDGQNYLCVYENGNEKNLSAVDFVLGYISEDEILIRDTDQNYYKINVNDSNKTKKSFIRAPRGRCYFDEASNKMVCFVNRYEPTFYDLEIVDLKTGYCLKTGLSLDEVSSGFVLI